MARTPPRPPKGTRFGGRTQGTPNVATATAREAIARFVDGNSERLQEWLDAIAQQEAPKRPLPAWWISSSFTSPNSPGRNWSAGTAKTSFRRSSPTGSNREG